MSKYRIAGDTIDYIKEKLNALDTYFGLKPFFTEQTTASTVTTLGVNHSFPAMDLICIRGYSAFKYWHSIADLRANKPNAGTVSINTGTVLSCVERLNIGRENYNQYTDERDLFFGFIDSDGKRKLVSFSKNENIYFKKLREYIVDVADYTPQKKQEILALQASLGKMNGYMFTAQKLVASLETKKNKTAKELEFINLYTTYEPILKQHFGTDKYLFTKVEMNPNHIRGIGILPIIVVAVVLLAGYGIYKGFDYLEEKAKIDLITEQAKVKIAGIASNNETLKQVVAGKISAEQAQLIFKGNNVAIDTASKNEATLIDQKGKAEDNGADKWKKMQNMAYAGVGIMALLVLPNILSNFKKRQ